VIPHPGAALSQNLLIKLAPRSCAIVYDALAAGRVGRDERWRFREIASEITINFDDAPRFISRTTLTPSRGVDNLGLMEGFNYFGSLIALRHAAKGGADAAAVDQAICATPGVWGGASSLTAGGLVAKFLAHSANALARAMTSAWSAARQQLLRMPAFDLRKL
jgi:urease accessory protein